MMLLPFHHCIMRNYTSDLKCFLREVDLKRLKLWNKHMMFCMLRVISYHVVVFSIILKYTVTMISLIAELIQSQ